MSFYFAWVPDGGTTFGVEHQVEDEQIFAFTIEHQEGDFASLSIDIVNPRVGLLGPDRDLWCWLSWRKPDTSVVALFHGRLVGVPETIDKTVVTLEFIARPEDYEEQKAALAESLKVAPYWDPIWIDADSIDDPDVVLEARPELWHIGRTDKLVTTSNILIPEDGQIAIGEADVFEESLEITYGDDPIRHAHMDATVTWDQTSKGTVDLTQSLITAFGGGTNISSYTGQGLEASWPVFGDDIGGGWTVGNSTLKLLSTSSNSSFISTPIDPSTAAPEEGDITIEDWWADSPEGFDYWYNLAVDAWIAEQMANPTTEARFYKWVFQPHFEVNWDATRSRSETLSFDVLADIQELVVDEETNAAVTDFSLSSDTIIDPVDPGELAPIGNVNSRTYFGLDRAAQSISYLLSYVRSRILISARAVEITFEVPFEIITGMSCRKGVILTLPDLPGGECEGKIISYEFGLDNGELSGSVTIGCSIGKGNSLPAPDAGDPSYVVVGYVVDYQTYIGATLDAIPGWLTYDAFSIPPVDDGVDFNNMTPATVITDTAASALLTLATAGTLDQTFSIGSRTYTLKTTLTAADQVLIGLTPEETARNLADAINATEGLGGVRYGSGTVAHAQAHAVAQDNIIRVTASVAGPAGNGIAVSGSGWSSATLEGGDEGLIVVNKASEQENVLEQTYGSVQSAIDALNAQFTEVQLALVPLTGGPYETLFPITVSDLMVPKTIDLEAT